MKLFYYFIIFIFLFLPVLVLAQNTNQACDSLTGVCNPAGSEKTWTVEGLAAKMIRIVLGLVGVVSLILFIYAGFIWMTAQGKSDVIKKARDTMLWAVLGLLVVFTSYAIVSFVLKEMPL